MSLLLSIVAAGRTCGHVELPSSGGSDQGLAVLAEELELNEDRPLATPDLCHRHPSISPNSP
jgi:hypothetical protein